MTPVSSAAWRLGYRIQCLALIQGLSIREIASVLRVTPDSVATHLCEYQQTRASEQYQRTVARIQERLNRAGAE